ncbi:MULTISPECIES: type II toxin-antitoxin system RelE/ParE family toxin [Gammaproteobacteria]|uniref:Plasmid stabilization protein n=1 Tax=Aliidiomarina maris TaxID=531312 RepID=A0A327WP07_9GAMM|nr:MULTISPECIES: type II toxin-antitoxin system RelE/ParE family toxin [Gammaproteobacteria]MEC5588721.1 type II toxin-antitoxin system RelE/ParE family toxin [Klebsiella pneumoniae]RAJ92918.1 plasmid stabilization system protein ParE [Aliidiomarina maris]RUO22126.1 plasmid stabilization protein [Aliidiomarina maris]
MKVVWSPLALERVESIAQYIAEDKPSAALHWVDGLFSCVDRLAEFPESGRVVPEVRLQRIREVVFGSYRVIYSITNQVDILTVRRSSQLLKASEFGVDET